MAVTVLYVDDEITEPGRAARKIQELLEVPDKFNCILRLPPKRLSDLEGELPDALLVDLDLTTAMIDGEPITYFGSTLASEMRRRRPTCPIILITKPNIIAANPEQILLLEDSIDVDLIIDKDEVNIDSDGVRRRIVALVEGFQALEAIKGADWEQVTDLMKADKEEANLLKEAAQPLEHGKWTIPQVARWIRRVVMGFPGILYDDLTAATRLGIDLSSFCQSDIEQLFEAAKYTGVFSTYKERWWRNRLFSIAQKLIIENNLLGSIPEMFSQAFNLATNKQLKPAICVHDGTATADWICYILKKPVKLQNSLPYYPDNRPKVMDQARVSFRAIQESEEFDERLVDADGFRIVRKLWEIE